MKKTLILLSAAIMAASATAWAGDGKKKNKQKQAPATEQQAEPVSLLSESDSISFAAGMSCTRGLMAYLVEMLKVDTACMDDFIAGYREAMTRQADPKYKARVAGTQIASQVETQFLPRMMQQFGGTDALIDPVLMHEGFIAGVRSDTTVMTTGFAQDYMEAVSESKKKTLGEANRLKGEQFLAENAKQPGVITTASGLQYKVLTEGTGAKPTASDVVTVRYEGRLIDGTVFDSSYKRKPDTTSFKVSSLIKGWVEALQLMPVGSKWELYIPYNLAYGERNAGGITPYSTLIFTMELVGIQDPVPAKK